MLSATEDISTVTASLDQLTSDVATAINTQQQAGFSATGSPGVALFDVAAPPGTALGLTVNSALSAQPSLLATSATASDPNDGSNAATTAALQDQQIATGGTQTASNAYANIVGAVGQLKSTSAQAVTSATAVQSQAKSLLDSQSGVSLDQEMVNMQTYQGAYEAASRLLSTVSTLLHDLMTSVA